MGRSTAIWQDLQGFSRSRASLQAPLSKQVSVESCRTTQRWVKGADRAVIETYHRPATLDEALALLGADGAAVLGGGTSLVAANAATGLIDLQDLGLNGIELDGDRVVVGAMVRLRDLAESDLAPAMLRDLAKREAPSTIRNVATIGGAIATGDFESELLAGLLVFEAQVAVVDSEGETSHSLGDYLRDRPLGIITKVTVATGGTSSAARTARTPADRPIVMAAVRRTDDGDVFLALTGVSATPIAIDPDALDSLNPPGDFRGTTEYRIHLARTLSRRAVEGLDS